ncbi:murein hydrolase activator EnvC family protein [Primorskyibacter sp. S187A]|uniref:murein hydrolase activator EnvC family protein n=1 Tax=Primorskyibacter sp. S187A TaxID=3415130 RepID=UPI003C79E864
MTRLFAAVWAICLAGTALAETPAQTAERALSLLNEASRQLEEAGSGRERVRALTATVQGYEKGLSALREGLRAAAQREAQLSVDLTAQEAEIGQLLGALQVISRVPEPLGLVHPAGPSGTARAGMLLADVTPGLQAEVEQLRAQVQEMQDLRVLQEQAATRLADGLAGAQTARTALSQAMADRTDLPKRFTEDPIQTAVMIASTETLEGFASALTLIEDDPAAPQPAPIAALKGTLPLPVAGQVLRRAGQADSAGVVRPGLLVATGSEALVTTPVPATIRYRGPLLNFGLVSILEPEGGMLFVFAGMAQVFGEAGQVIPAGDPVGLMGGTSQSSEGGGNTRPETLYIEVRENNRTVDPETWFRTGRE